MTNTILTLLLILVSALGHGQPPTAADSPDAMPDKSNMEDQLSEADNPNNNSSIPRQSAEDIYEYQKSILEQQYPKEDILQLSANGEKFLALWDKDKSGAPVGTVLLLHGEGQTANWPHTIDTLRADLTHHGWSTLSISLTDPISAPYPKRIITAGLSGAEETLSTDDSSSASDTQSTNNDETNASAENPAKNMTKEPMNSGPKYSPQEVESRVQNRIKAAVNHLNEEGQFNIAVASYGLSSQRAAQYIQSMETSSTNKKSQQGVAVRPGARQNNLKDRTVRALILINARNEISSTETSLVDLLDMGEMPILDLYSDMHFLDKKEAKERLQAARNNGMKQYAQVKFLPPTTRVFNNENRMTRRVRGFLSKHAKGVEIGVK